MSRLHARFTALMLAFPLRLATLRDLTVYPAHARFTVFRIEFTRRGGRSGFVNADF